MNMQSIRVKSTETKATIENQKVIEAERARQEKLQRIVDAISTKAMNMAEAGTICPEWMKKEARQLGADIRLFIHEGEGQSLMDFIEDGCAVFFGPTSSEAIATKDFGTYILSLEKNLEGARFPKTLKINLRAHSKLAKLLSKRLGVESVSVFAVNEILKAEEDGKLSVDFVTVESIPDDTEVVELAKTTTLIGKATEVEVVIVAANVNGKIFVTRTDWYDGCGKVPEDSGFIFDLRHIYRPRA